MHSQLIHIFAIAITIFIADECNSWKLMVQIKWPRPPSSPSSNPLDYSNRLLVQLRASNSNWNISSEKCALFTDNYDLVTFLSEKHFPNLLDEFGRQINFLMDIKIGDKLAATNIRIKGVNKIVTYSLVAQKLIEDIPYSNGAAIGKAFPQRILQFIFIGNLSIWLLKIECRIEGKLVYEIIFKKENKQENLIAKVNICPGDKYTMVYSAKENSEEEIFELDCEEATYEPNLVNKYRIEMSNKLTMPKAHSSSSSNKNQANCYLERQLLRVPTFQPEIKLRSEILEIFIEILQKRQKNARKVIGGFQVPEKNVGASIEMRKGAERVKALMKMVSTTEYQWGKEEAYKNDVDSNEEKIDEEKAIETNAANETANEEEQSQNKRKFVIDSESLSQPKLKMMQISPKEERDFGGRALDMLQQQELIKEYLKNAPDLREALAFAHTRNISNRYGGLPPEMLNIINSAILYLYKFHDGILSTTQISRELNMGQSANYVRTFLKREHIFSAKKGFMTISDNEMKLYKKEIRNHLKNEEGQKKSESNSETDDEEEEEYSE